MNKEGIKSGIAANILMQADYEDYELAFELIKDSKDFGVTQEIIKITKIVVNNDTEEIRFIGE